MAGEALSESYVTADSLDRELEDWLAELQPFQWRQPDSLQADSCALLVLDMTKPFVEDRSRPLCCESAGAIVERIGELVTAFRRARAPVIWLVQGHHSVAHDRGDWLAKWWPLPLLEGTDDVRMCSGLEPLPDEKIILKRRYSGFYQTDLEVTLRCLKVDQVVITGVLTNVCPFATAIDAFMRDFAVYYPADATASLTRQMHIGALQTIAGWAGYVVRARDLIDQLAQ